MTIATHLGNLWHEIRGTQPVAHPVKYNETLPIEDDPSDLVEDDLSAPSWIAQTITGRTIVIQYSDSKGQPSERQIVCRRLEQKAGITYLSATCLLRHRARSFRADRIAVVIDPTTGEIFDPGSIFITQFAPDEVSSSKFHYGLPPRHYGDFNAALNVLAFMARCDGQWHFLEESAIEDFATSYWIRSDIVADLDVDEVRRHAARLAPDAESLFTSLMRCQQNPVLSTIIRRHVAAVIDADGEHHPMELYWGRQIDEFLALP